MESKKTQGWRYKSIVKDGDWQKSFIGKVIVWLRLQPEGLEIQISGGDRYFLFDAGQSCCENRYLTCDDELHSVEGAVVLGITERQIPTVEDTDYVHECYFMEWQTTKGSITLAAHNEHNGYYSGFDVACGKLGEE